MNALFDEALAKMEEAFRRMEQRVPSPKSVPFKDGFVYRCVEKTIEQALIQKLARVISGLHAAKILLENGFLQEQAVLHRTLDELTEDIKFLTAALTIDTTTDLHQRYLRAFYDEEFDNPDDPLGSTQKRDMVPRQKIHSYITRVFGSDGNPSRDIALSRTLSKTYSGFVHAASPQIMDMWGGAPPGFHLRGMLGTPRMEEHQRDAWNYFYRGLLSTITVGIALGDREIANSLLSYKVEFERVSRKDYAA